jgi:DNA-directed RNA polymerase specialized sigma24 family protein
MPTLIPVITGGVVVAAVLCLSALLLLCKRQRTKRQRETDRIVALQRKIDAVLSDEGFESAREAFSVSLKTASLTTGLQRPRLETMAKINKQPPEKYRILGKLASQGMDAEEIAAILGISSVEAGQLLSLSTMAQIGR